MDLHRFCSGQVLILCGPQIRIARVQLVLQPGRIASQIGSMGFKARLAPLAALFPSTPSPNARQPTTMPAAITSAPTVVRAIAG